MINRACPRCRKSTPHRRAQHGSFFVFTCNVCGLRDDTQEFEAEYQRLLSDDERDTIESARSSTR